MSFLVVTCPRCGGLLLAKPEQNTRTCPYCGTKVAVDRAKRVATAKSAQEASKTLRRLKSEVAMKRKTA